MLAFGDLVSRGILYFNGSSRAVATAKGSSESGTAGEDTLQQDLGKFTTCFVCGTPVNVTSAHLLKSQYAAKAARCEHVLGTTRNFLRLCGTLGAPDSCHDHFDSKQMGFILDGSTARNGDRRLRRWIPFYTTGAVGRPCALPTDPPRHVMHAHAAMVMNDMGVSARQQLIRALSGLDSRLANDMQIHVWLDQLTRRRRRCMTTVGAW